MENISTWSLVTRTVDILIVAYIIYLLLKLAKDTQVMNLLKGVLLIVAVKMVSDYLTLYTLSWIIDQVITWGVVALIVIFQPEVRLYLTQLGKNNFLKRKKEPINQQEKLIEELSTATQYLSKRSIGALISIEMTTPLNSFASTGVMLNAAVSNQLLINIFIPNTPLHDGAIIIRGDKIISASSVLPLSENPDIPQELGTRHRAALGMSEQTDAIVIVVSEETGDISIAYKGGLNRHLTQQQFETLLTLELFDESANEKRSRFPLLQQFLAWLRKGGR